jgi:uncharacterized delta-60 repeat protein
VAARYNADGSPDPTFGNGAGYVRIHNPQYSAPYQYAYAVALETDGKLILAGTIDAASVTNGYSQVARLNVDGSLDTSFGTGGFEATLIGDLNNGGGGFDAVAIQPDGKIVAAGDAWNSANLELFSLARYLPSQPEVGTFTASPNPVTSGTAITLTASNITDGNAGGTITQVAFYVQLNGANTLLGYGTQTSPGVWTFNFTVSLAPGSYTLTAQATDSYGVLGDPLATTLTVQ